MTDWSSLSTEQRNPASAEIDELDTLEKRCADLLEARPGTG